MNQKKYKRVLLKISGESLMGVGAYGIDVSIVDRVAKEIAQVCSLGVEVCLVIGAGNIFRGLSGAAAGMDRASADYMGMLATVMNSLAMQNSLERLNIQTRVQSAISMTEVCETYTRRRAIRHMEKGRIVIFAAGTGNPYFTTDTAAALRASEMDCDAIFKGTMVDGIYDKDPKKSNDAKKFESISFDEVLANNLKVLDSSAVSLARDNNIPIIVFSIQENDSFLNIIKGKGSCSIVKESK
ncbi:MAG: UMP kinase [Pseudomonadota bacterium]|nr:UMP kinase [Pseudomonadota bacterium]MEC7735191.1 UMP kinase [Pseudomonadota bacterium]MEC9392508.1 UMP kinase [Pseudomonadota bacterium]MEC9459195.1 UMP kinase [Pseudomonadota bacterium]